MEKIRLRIPDNLPCPFSPLSWVQVYIFFTAAHPKWVYLIYYICPLGVEHDDFRRLCHLPEDSQGFCCETPSMQSSGICLVSVIHPPPVSLHPNLQNRIPQDYAASEIT